MTETVSALTNLPVKPPEASRQSVRASRNVPQASQGSPTELRRTPEASSRSLTELRCTPEGSFRSLTGLRRAPEGSSRSGRALLRLFIHFTYLGKAFGQPKKPTPRSPSAPRNLPDIYRFGVSSLSLPRRGGEGWGEGLSALGICPAASPAPHPDPNPALFQEQGGAGLGSGLGSGGGCKSPARGRGGEGWGEGLRVMAQAAAPLIRPAATFSPPPRRGEGVSRLTHFL